MDRKCGTRWGEGKGYGVEEEGLFYDMARGLTPRDAAATLPSNERVNTMLGLLHQGGLYLEHHTIHTIAIECCYHFQHQTLDYSRQPGKGRPVIINTVISHNSPEVDSSELNVSIFHSCTLKT